MAMEFRMPGPFEVRDGERVVPLRRKKHRALLALLVLRAGEAVSADVLVEELWLSAREDLCDAELEVGGGADLVSELEALVAEQPFRERLRGQHMLALYRAGREVDALQAYRGARSVLLEELGLEPGAAL